ncbi:MAG: transglycosylase domain-containing protein [Myxococcota bacterium]|nr:transglycosylase domain-containing protein [Myxococcota bacterium]
MGPKQKYLLLSISLLFGVAVGGIWPNVIHIRDKTRAMADAHRKHETAHKGWSFPAKVWSNSANLDLPAEQLMEHARLRNYTQSCPARDPGEYCPKTGTVVPRGGAFPEGKQPPGLAGWTRPVALEPMIIGYLIGPDAEIRDHLPLEEAPEHLIDAILASEDSNFWNHFGVDLRGLMRATMANAKTKSYGQGASTLHMQVVRSLSQNKEDSLRRKLREIAMAFTLDGYIGKEGVLQMYLDVPYLGQSGTYSICGFEAAARHYWGKAARDLTLGEAATLVGILPRPASWGPDIDPSMAKIRRDKVLKRMEEVMGYDVSAARAEPVVTKLTPVPPTVFPSYMQATRAWLEAHLPTQTVYGSGLNVYTALDVVAQTRTEEVINAKLEYLEDQLGRNGDQPLQAAGALVDPYTGAMVAVYGGRDSTATGFNRATQARRQAGSSFKPLVYALAFSRMDGDGMPLYTAADTVPNERRTFENTDGWRPRNVGGKYTPSIPLAQALASSSNIGTASLLEELGGPRHLVDFADRLGFEKRWLPEELGLALGQGEVTPLEMAGFAAAVINGGRKSTGSPVLLARDAAQQIPVGALSQERPVMSPEAAALTMELMRGVVLSGTGGAIRGVNGIAGYTGEAIGKTGTTDNEYDLWFVGGTPHYASALWVGYDTPTRVGGSASEVAAPLWGWWMDAVASDLGERSFDGPELQYRRICTVTGLRPQTGQGCKSIRAPFLPGTAPRGTSDVCDKDDPEKKFVSLWNRRQQARQSQRSTGPKPATPSNQASGKARSAGPAPF